MATLRESLREILEAGFTIEENLSLITELMASYIATHETREGVHIFQGAKKILEILNDNTYSSQGYTGKIPAIKWARAEYGLGLKEAKDLVEAVMDGKEATIGDIRVHKDCPNRTC